MGEGSETTVNFGDLTQAWLHLRVEDKAGNWSNEVSRMVLVDSQAPTAQPVAPANGAKTAVSETVISLGDAGLGGIDPNSVRLSVGGAEYTVDGRGLSFQPASGRLIWNCENVSPQPVVFPDKKDVEVKLLAAADYAGNPVQQLPAWTWTMDYSQDKQPPVVSEVHSTTHPTLVTDTFEEGLDRWQNRDGANGAKVERDSETAASGKTSVRLTNQRAGGHMQATIYDDSYVVERYPLISFDYRIPPSTRLDLQFLMAGKWYAVTLTDSPVEIVGRVPNIIADGKWRHAEFDLQPLLRKQQDRGALVVSQIIIGDRNRMDNEAGATAWFDNFIIGQVGKYPPVLRWRATDATGVKGYSYTLDRDPAGVPDDTPEGSDVAKTFGALEPGLWFFHVRAQDGAGNWGPTTTYGVMHLRSG